MKRLIFRYETGNQKSNNENTDRKEGGRSPRHPMATKKNSMPAIEMMIRKGHDSVTFIECFLLTIFRKFTIGIPSKSQNQ
jgi:hypothetical protein